MDSDSWMIIATIAIIILGIGIYLGISSGVVIDWNSIFNVKTYPK